MKGNIRTKQGQPRVKYVTRDPSANRCGLMDMEITSSRHQAAHCVPLVPSTPTRGMTGATIAPLALIPGADCPHASRVPRGPIRRHARAPAQTARRDRRRRTGLRVLRVDQRRMQAPAARLRASRVSLGNIPNSRMARPPASHAPCRMKPSASVRLVRQGITYRKAGASHAMQVRSARRKIPSNARGARL